MAEKKFAGLTGTVESAEIAADFDSAVKYERVKIGKLGVYYRDGLKTRYIPYADMERAFLRVQEVNGRLCCGNTTFAYYHLIFIVNGKECGDILSEDEKLMKDALAAISAAAPGLAIGVAQ